MSLIKFCVYNERVKTKFLSPNDCVWNKIVIIIVKTKWLRDLFLKTLFVHVLFWRENSKLTNNMNPII